MGLFGGIYNLFELIYEEGEKEWLDESRFTESLNELNTQLDNGKITDEEYEEAENEILRQLKEVRKYKKEHGYTGS